MMESLVIHRPTLAEALSISELASGLAPHVSPGLMAAVAPRSLASVLPSASMDNIGANRYRLFTAWVGCVLAEVITLRDNAHVHHYTVTIIWPMT